MKFFLISVLVVFSLAVAWKINFPSGSWRYKITIEIETPEGIKSGSAVRHVRAVIPLLKLPESKTIDYEVTGEAVVIDLGEQRYVFALTSLDGYYETFRAFPFSGGDAKDRLKHYSSLPVGSKAELKIGHPRMVTFENINDPKSVKEVYGQSWSREEGYKTHDDFANVFGEGYKLKSITIEMTDEPVTSVVDKILPWLKDLNGHYLHGGMTSRQAPLGLHGGNFRTGEN